MARLPHDGTAGHTDSNTHHSIVLDANAGHTLTLPGHEYVTDAQMLRDGQDLVLHPAHGDDVVVKNYFSVDHAPVLSSADGGSALTSDLVHSFVKPMGGMQFAQNGSVDDVSPVGAVKETSGEATITHADGTVQKAAIGTPIFEGDIVETKAHGAVNITFVDKTTFAVSENAKMSIDQYVFDPATQHGENNFSVLRGVFVFTSGLIGHADPDDVKINTPVGSIGIRGTTIMGTINPGHDSHITVVEGAIVVSNTAGEQTLSQQFETVTLQGMNHPITSNGVQSAESIANSYNVLRTVSGPLFSTFDDMGHKNATPDQPAGDHAPADAAPVHKSDAAPADAHQTTMAQTDITPGQSSLDSSFDKSANLASATPFTSEVVSSAAISGSSLNTTATSSAETTSSITLSTAPVSTQSTTTSYTVPVTVPGPVTTTTGSTSSGPTASTPETPLSLNDVISNLGGGTFIPSIVAGSQHGSSVAALGDYNHDGKMDYAFTDSVATNNVLYVDDSLGNNYALNLTNSPYSISDATHTTIASAGDFNGDGKGDIVIGAYNADNTTFSSGTVVIASGDALSTSATTITGFQSGQQAGLSVAGIGDYNGDGYTDIIIGAPSASGIGNAYVFFGHSGAATMDITNILPAQGFIIPGSTFSELGQSVAGIGDVNHDGYSDLAVSSPGTGTVAVHFGNANGIDTTPLTITGLTTNASAHLNVMGLGDINGDGISDFGIQDVTANKFYIFDGTAGAGGGTANVSAANVTISPSVGTIITAGSAGDFNGDGQSDAMIAIRNGSQVDIYVVYGSTTFSGTIDPTSLADDKVFHMSLDLTGSQFNLANPSADAITLSLSSAGDLNGDGYDDLLIGVPNVDANGGSHTDDGGLIIVQGRAESGDITSGTSATAASQSLVGTTATDTMSNGTAGYAGASLHAGAGNDTINIFGSAGQSAIDGGTGIDTLNFATASANIDLRGLGNNLSNIEQISLGGAGQTLTLGLDQVFNLLHESENGSLTISTSQTGTQLHIDSNAGAAANLTAAGFTDQGAGGTTLEHWTFGSYNLYIDNSIATTVANVA